MMKEANQPGGALAVMNTSLWYNLVLIAAYDASVSFISKDLQLQAGVDLPQNMHNDLGKC
jgi:hypothetical protein